MSAPRSGLAPTTTRHETGTMLKRIGLLLSLSLMLSACGALRPHHPPPGATEGKVAVAGMPGVRAWGDAFSPEFQKDMIESVAQEKAG